MVKNGRFIPKGNKQNYPASQSGTDGVPAIVKEKTSGKQQNGQCKGEIFSCCSDINLLNC